MSIREANLLLHSIEKWAKEIGLQINIDKTEYMTFNQHNTIRDVMSIQNGERMQVNDFKYLGSYIASTEHDINIRIGKNWYTLNQLTNICKSRLSKNLKRNFFRTTVESVLVYGTITWTLTSTPEKNIDGAYMRMLRAALNVSWREHMTNRELYNNIPRITSSIRKQRMRFSEHCCRSKNELVSDVLLWTPKHGQRSRGRPASTFVDQMVEDTEFEVEELINLKENRN